MPVELYIDPKYNALFPERQFIKYTYFCNRSDSLQVNELILYEYDITGITPARILKKEGESYLILTLNGEILIDAKSIVA